LSIVVSKKVKPKKKVSKKCQFPGCTATFMGIGPSKYCEEHQQIKHRKTINKMLNKRKEARRPKIDNANQIIKHKSNEVYQQECTCSLEGCGQKFQIIIIPRTLIYPTYCEQHRSQYKRELFIKTHNKIKEQWTCEECEQEKCCLV
jgi:hypothetical protein